MRFRGLFWGEYQYLHPDERFMVWVGTDISPVNNLGEYWDTASSSLNPHNRGHGFYVYGTLPLYMARYAVEWIYGHSGFNEMTNAGRFLSAFADLLTVLFVYLIGTKAYDRRVGLLAAGLSAFAVLQIQQSHFFTVDTFTTLFTVAAAYFAVSVANNRDTPQLNNRQDESRSQSVSEGQITQDVRENQSRKRQLIDFIKSPDFLLAVGFGIALGMAAASKVSAAPVAILLPGAFLIRLSYLDRSEQDSFVWHGLGYLALAAGISLLVFRVFQPIAFSGPGFFGISPNQAWVANLRELQTQASGDVDFPPALQWARRPVWFAWENMVRWGMGLPMGLLAWTGYLWAGWRMIRGEFRKHILLWGWTGLIFVWQSLIFNPSMRYQLLIYPILAIFAGWAVIQLFDSGRNKLKRNVQVDEPGSAMGDSYQTVEKKFNWLSPLAILIGVGVLIATAIYAYSFSNIYIRPITRVDASRWIYQNIPGPITLPIQTGEGEYNQQVSYPYNYQINQDLPFVSSFRAHQQGELSELQVHRIVDPETNFGPKSIRLTISEIPGGGGSSSSAVLNFEVNPAGQAGNVISSAIFENRIELEANRDYYIQMSLPPGQGPISINAELELVLLNDQLNQERIPLRDEFIDSITQNLVSFSSSVDGVLSEARLIIADPPSPTEKTLRFEISAHPDNEEILASGTISGSFIGEIDQPGYVVPLARTIELEENQEYFLRISLVDSESSLVLRGAPVANEGAWDDGLPVRLDGYDGFAGIYEPGLNFDMYEDDNPNKLSRFYDILDHTEYIFFSSSRQWGTLPRIPERFPMSSEYYRHLLGCPGDLTIEECYNTATVELFKGDLGFDLIEVFQSDPASGLFTINDQASEEAFTVYDHPKVFIFQKNENYDPAQVREVLGSVDLSRVEHITPKKAGALPKDMMLPFDRWMAQIGEGTWSTLYNLEGWINRYPALTVIVWYLAVAALGLIAYPILRSVFSGLADRGYPLSRTAGLLFLSYIVWLGGSFNIGFKSITIWIVIILLAIVAAVLVYFQRESLKSEWRERRTYFLVIEGLFLAFFLIDLLIRLGNPDLWHPWKGGERPMDFSYLNAVLKSTSFPPYDPWFSGGYINYYYYGFVYVGVLVKWLGIVPSVAYNLIIPTVFSFLVMGAFSIGWNLVSYGKTIIHYSSKLIRSIPFITGLAAAFAVGVLGNLGTLRMISRGYQMLAAPDGNIEGANIISRIIWVIQGAFMSLTGSSLPYGIADWYWFPSRVIPAPNDVEPITEFPFFTVLYGDPHAHLFALPLTILALAWALSILFARGWGSWDQDNKFTTISRAGASLLIGGLAIGALRPTNTWDFPLYLVFGLLVVGYVFWKYADPLPIIAPRIASWPLVVRRILISFIAVILLGIFAFVLYQPYANWYVQGYTNISFWRGSHTPFWSYLTHWGVFLFVITSWLFWETREWMANTPLADLRKLSPYKGLILVGILLTLVWIIALQYIGISIAWMVILLMIWSGILLFRPGMPDAKRAVLFMIGSGLAFTLMVEVIVLVGDIGRMNTVFKFYLQVWTLFGLSAAAGFGWLLGSITLWTPRWQFVWKTSVVVLVAAAALYPLLGTTARVKDRMTDGVPLTLDGMEYMQFAEYDDLNTRMDLSQDYEAIRWLQDNVEGSPVIIEGNMVEYHWGTRNTIYTGLPNVIGWNWHQRQQRATAPGDLVQSRIGDVNEFYITSDPDRARQILEDYGVQYVIVGQLERALYPGDGLTKFSTQEGTLWEEVFRLEDTVVYHVLN